MVLGTVLIQDYTTKNPIEMIGKEAGICWGSDTETPEKNYKRGINCLESGHGRTFEYPDIYMVIDGYSARVIREWYTHIGGAPTRLQSSTRYINYEKGFDYVTPHTVQRNEEAERVYTDAMESIAEALRKLEALEIPREDSAMLLPLGMTTKIVDRRNLRNLIDMSRQRMCSRAFWEFRELFSDICEALGSYSEQWKYLVDHYMMPKCDVLGYCPEARSCGRHPKRGNS